MPGGVREEAAFQMSAYSTAVDYEFINFTNKTLEGVTATVRETTLFRYARLESG